jgi:primosomal protein N' (replication factor Y)
LTQVSGRAGRGDEPGEVVIQTYNPAHPSIRFAALHDYEGFSREELAFRKELSFPPYRRLARILLLGISLERVTQAAHEMAEILHGIPSPSIEVLGPAPAPIEKLRGKYRWQFILKYGSPRKGHQVLQKAAEEFKVKHPSSRGVRLEIDIDPQSLL